MTDISYEWTTCIGIKAYIMIVYFQQDKKGMICWKMKVICILNKKLLKSKINQSNHNSNNKRIKHLSHVEFYAQVKMVHYFLDL